MNYSTCTPTRLQAKTTTPRGIITGVYHRVIGDTALFVEVQDQTRGLDEEKEGGT